MSKLELRTKLDNSDWTSKSVSGNCRSKQAGRCPTGIVGRRPSPRLRRWASESGRLNSFGVFRKSEDKSQFVPEGVLTSLVENQFITGSRRRFIHTEYRFLVSNEHGLGHASAELFLDWYALIAVGGSKDRDTA